MGHTRSRNHKFVSSVILIVWIAMGGLIAMPAYAQMQYHGGRMLAKPHLYAVYWGEQTYQAEMDSFYPWLLSGSFTDLLSEYSDSSYLIRRGGLRGDIVDSFPEGQSETSDAQIQTEIQSLVNRGYIKTDSDILVAVHLPASTYFVAPDGVPECQDYPDGGVTPDNDYGGGCHCSYHTNVQINFPNDIQQSVAYMVLPDQATTGGDRGTHCAVMTGSPVDAETVWASHEIAESITDPDNSSLNSGAWYDSSTGKEMADVCEGPNNIRDAWNGPFLVQKVWSMNTSSCVSEMLHASTADISADGFDDLFFYNGSWGTMSGASFQYGPYDTDYGFPNFVFHGPATKRISGMLYTFSHPGQSTSGIYYGPIYLGSFSPTLLARRPTPAMSQINLISNPQFSESALVFYVDQVSHAVNADSISMSKYKFHHESAPLGSALIDSSDDVVTGAFDSSSPAEALFCHQWTGDYSHKQLWYLSEADPISSPKLVGLTEFSSSTKYVAGDFDGSGIDSVAAYDPETYQWSIGKIVNGSLTFSASTYQWLLLGDTQMLTADFNLDGKEDLLEFDKSTGELYVGLSSGTGFNFTDSAPLGNAVATPSPLFFIGDFARYGIDDILVYNNATRSMWLVQNNGDGTLAVPTSEYAAVPQGLGPVYAQ